MTSKHRVTIPQWVEVLLLAVSFLGSCHGFPTGAPSFACETMKPLHNVDPQITAAPYALTFNKTGTTYSPGEQITMTLSSTGVDAFRGYLLQARKASSAPNTTGSFTLASGMTNKCNGPSATSVTQDSAVDKRSVSVTWTAPFDYTGDVVFVYTVVGREKRVYWVKLTSATFTYAGPTVTGTSSPTPVPQTTPVSTKTPMNTGITLDPACGVTKSCLHDCTAVATGCTYLASWVDGGGDTLEITLKRQVSGDAWTAIGFSDAPTMTNTSVSSCESVGGLMSVKSSYNDKYSNIDLQNPSFGVSLTSGGHTNGVLSCTFTRAKTASIAASQTGRRKRAVSADDTHFFDLNSDWFVMLAYGRISGGARVGHTVMPFRSPQRIDLQTVLTTPTSSTPGAPQDGAIQKDKGCGHSKGCLHDCDSSGSCSFLNTWVDNGGEEIEFTMRYKTGGQNMYTAMGLSNDEKMGDDHVLECVSDGQSANVFLSFNEESPRSNSRLSEPELGVQLKSSSHKDGILECVFSRKKTLTLANSGRRRKRAATDASTYFDLNSDWYLLHAHGSSIAEFKSKHTDLPMSTSVEADFQAHQDLGMKHVTSIAVKVHGILMVLAWTLSASIGIILARFYKPAWGDSTLCGEKVWFQLHRALMVSVFLLVVAAFILIFVHAGGYSQMADNAVEKAHPIMGIIITCLAVINPIMALFRPHPDTPRRPVFNIAHFLVGSAAYILAMVNIFFGVSLKVSSVSDMAKYVLYVWVAWQIVMNILLTIYDCLYTNSESSDSEPILNQTRRTEEYHMHDIGKESDVKGPQTTGKGQPLKKMIFMLHVVAIIALSIAVCVIIGQS